MRRARPDGAGETQLVIGGCSSKSSHEPDLFNMLRSLATGTRNRLRTALNVLAWRAGRTRFYYKYGQIWLKDEKSNAERTYMFIKAYKI